MSRKHVVCFWFALALSSCTTQAQNFTILHTFTNGVDGGFPIGHLVFDQAGNLYGATQHGGQPSCLPDFGCGVVYQYAPSSGTLTTIYAFLDGADGRWPNSGVTFGPDGALYGTAPEGGAHHSGTIFRLAPSGGQWTETTLHAFNSFDGDQPLYPVSFDQAGNLYGASSGGCTWGQAFELPAPLGQLPLEMLHCFGEGSDGRLPSSGVVIDNLGNLYGLTHQGGDYDEGAAYELSPSASGWTERVLHSFGRMRLDGIEPHHDFLMDSTGNLYGGTDLLSIVFELSPSGGGWTFTQLFGFDFAIKPYQLGIPALAMDDAGNLYGTTEMGGRYHLGSLFKLTHAGNRWAYTNLHDFTGGDDGYYPRGLGVAPDGTLYGTSSEGGNTQQCQVSPTLCGVLWKIAP
jgi:uncharacterized repeat protein (TIGR03803 family)